MMLAVALALALAQGDAREPIGVFESWGAFRDVEPARCYAIAAPVQRRRRGAFASIATWPGKQVHNQLHIRLSRQRTPRARVTLAIGERRFQLKAGDRDAWSPDARTDRAIVGAIRAGRSMSVESIAANGAPFADVYALAGAATAIDAAGVGCARRPAP
ncbi:hypothetical protein OKW76_12870 [Sphingomonas sp. S1-29]|uniref:hypothetical protein n=1 Tax=Sphingomonas sp. S1-29 TaxID=2991074 RepID=UPI0022409563|nr:hypothetical protein [Sphingomonas sp. S1-29]UZK68917.1 hypothetical protein OKW76_12870 [Sphingomonas sp. S1-29]